MGVITRASCQLAVPGNDTPIPAAIIRPPQRTVPVGLDQRVDAIRVGRSDCYIHFADRLGGQAVTADTRPMLAIVSYIDTTTGPTAVFAPGVHIDLPGPG